MNIITHDKETVSVKKPRFLKQNQWRGFINPPWFKTDKKKVTILYSIIERRKSFFLRAFFIRHGYRFIDMGDHIKEDVRWGKEYGNRMECNPMYFTSGSIIRNLLAIHRETGLSKEEIVEQYVFLSGGGQCGPCRYGMYPQEYLKALNDAGFKGFRLLVFSSDIFKMPKTHAFRFTLGFRINFLIAFVLADLMHIAECALRPYAKNKEQALETIKKVEELLFRSFTSRWYLVTLPFTLAKAGAILSAIPRISARLPQIFMTGEFFANLAHNEGNYNLRRFIMDEGCEVIPGIFTQRALYDNWRRIQEAKRGIIYSTSVEERKAWKRSLFKQKFSTAVINLFYYGYCKALKIESIGGKSHLMDLDKMAQIAREYYHPEIFGGEGHLEIAEAIYYANKVEGFISSKPFGCMPSSGVSDGVQSKIIYQFPNLNFLSIETSGDNEVSILSRVSMMLFKAKQKVHQENIRK